MDAVNTRRLEISEVKRKEKIYLVCWLAGIISTVVWANLANYEGDAVQNEYASLSMLTLVFAPVVWLFLSRLWQKIQPTHS